ncbi:hypothetical protein B2J88_34365 [Rhodococcus sp. SRB_17]|nr:hypothetical protein [Rhodococcus sp. SRB_17]
MHGYEDFEWTSAERLACLTAGSAPWEYYLQTEMWFEDADQCGTLRPLSGGEGGDHPPLGSLHVVTAIQPDAEPSNDESVRRMRVLDRELQSAGIRSIRAVGSSFDGKHSEDSRAVFGLDDGQARALGLRFGQVAVFAWCGPQWSLLACASERATHRAWTWHP